MTTTLRNGQSIQINGLFGLIDVRPGTDNPEPTFGIGRGTVWGFQPGVELPIYKIPTVKASLDKNCAQLIVDKELVVVEGRFYRVYFQRAEVADFIYFDHVMPHINLNRTTK